MENKVNAAMKEINENIDNSNTYAVKLIEKYNKLINKNITETKEKLQVRAY